VPSCSSLISTDDTHDCIKLARFRGVLCDKDVSRTNGVTHFYEVTAINSAGESANSAPVSAKPGLPQILKARMHQLGSRRRLATD
jgi:hypothetical protein